MYECYTVEVEGTGLRFAARKDGGKDIAYLPGQPPKGYTLVNLIGDPGFLHCAVFVKTAVRAALPCMTPRACCFWLWPKAIWPTAWASHTWAAR